LLINQTKANPLVKEEQQFSAVVPTTALGTDVKNYLSILLL